jgi:hypothetical protein
LRLLCVPAEQLLTEPWRSSSTRNPEEIVKRLPSLSAQPRVLPILA